MTRRKRNAKNIAKVGGQRLATELKGKDLDRVLVVPVDGGKRSHKALIADALGEVIVEPFKFDNDLAGAKVLEKAIKEVSKKVGAVRILIGVEPTGHYLENLVAYLLRNEHDVREVNTYSVDREREAGLTWCKTDEIDLCAIGQLLINGRGKVVGQIDSLYYNLKQATRARRSSVRRKTTIVLQIHSYMDRLFPGFLSSGILGEAFNSTSRAFMARYGSANATIRSGQSRSARWPESCGVSDPQEKAEAIVILAKGVLCRPSQAEEALLQALRSRLEELEFIDNQIKAWEVRLAEYLVETPGIWLLQMQKLGLVTTA